MSLNANQHLQSKLLVDNKSLMEIDKAMDEIINHLSIIENPKKAGLNMQLQSKIYTNVHNIKINLEIVNKLYISCAQKFEVFIRDVMEYPLKQVLQNAEALQIEKIDKFLNVWEYNERLYKLTYKFFKHIPMDNHSEHQCISDVLIGLFREIVLESTEIKGIIEEFCISTLRSQAKIDETSTNDESPTQNKEGRKGGCGPLSDRAKVDKLIRVLTYLDYRPSKFEDPFKTMTEKIFSKYQIEIAKEREPKETIYSRQHSSNYHSEPSNPYPEKCDSGHIGLQNQGATCYLNSVLQSLFMTKPFRRLLFKWRYNPQTDKPEKKCITLQLQKLFARLRLIEKRSVETTDLTTSFGWTKRDSFVQHDAQELLRVLFDALDKCIPLNELFQGISRDYVICSECHRVGGRADKYLDLQLVTRDMKHLDQAFENYQFEELLHGENQYKCEQCNRHVDARRGTYIETLPDILTLHLKRFDIDYTTFENVKLNNKVIFPLQLDMNKHMQKGSPSKKTVHQWDPSNIYNLFAVQIHSGGVGGGHYYAYIKDKNSWYEFNDSNVSPITEKELQKSFGDHNNSCSNAYMLWYMRDKPVSSIHSKIIDLSDEEEIELLPENIREEIAKENQEVFNARRKYHLHGETIKIPVFYNNVKNLVSVSKTKSLADLRDVITETILKDKKIATDCVKLKYYDEKNRIANGDITFDKDSKVENIAVSPDGMRQTFLLETKAPDDKFALPSGSNSLFVKICIFDNEKQEFTDQIALGLPNDCTVNQLKQEIAANLGISESQQTLIYQFCNSYTNNMCFSLLVEPDKQLKGDYKIKHGDCIYVERTLQLNSFESEALIKLKEKVNQIRIIISVPSEFKKGLPELKYTLDKEQSLQYLKDLVSKDIGVAQETFKLQDDESERAYIFNDLELKLSQFPSEITLYVKKGKQLSLAQYNITFYLYERPKSVTSSPEDTKEEVSKMSQPVTTVTNQVSLENSHQSEGQVTSSNHPQHDIEMENNEETSIMGGLFDHHAGGDYAVYYTQYKASPNERVNLENLEDISFVNSHKERDLFRKVVTLTVKKDTTVGELKSTVREYVALHHNIQLPESQIRMREKLLGRLTPGRILSNDECPIQSISSSTTSRDIILEKLDIPESVDQSCMIVRVARFYPSKWLLGQSEEIPVKKDFSFQQLKQYLSNKYLLSEDVLDVVKIPLQLQYQLKYTPNMVSLQWDNPQLYPQSLISKGPWYLKDGDLLLFRDLTEIDYFTLQKSSETDGTDSNPQTNTNPMDRSARRSSGKRRQETGVKFYTGDLRDDPASTANDSKETSAEKNNIGGK